MDSELTLVNPAPPTSYFLSSTDLKDAVVFARPSVPLYKITSDARHLKISDSTTPNRTVAILHRRDLLPDTIYFPQRRNSNGSIIIGTQMSFHRWLKRSKMPDGTPAFAFDTQYGRYFWRTVSRHRQKVFSECDLDNPIASCYLNQTLPPDRPAFVLQSAAEPLRDDIVVSYIVQLHRVLVESHTLDLFVGPN